MKLDLTGKGIDITPGIQEYATKKVQKLEKFFEENTLVHVTFSAKKEQQNVDIRVEYKGKTYLAEENTHDVYAGMDLAIDKLLGQIRKQKTKMLKDRMEQTTEESVDDSIEE